MTEDVMVRWHHQHNGHEFEQVLGDSEGQESLVCCSPWGRKESDIAERLNSNSMKVGRHKLWICSCLFHRKEKNIPVFTKSQCVTSTTVGYK